MMIRARTLLLAGLLAACGDTTAPLPVTGAVTDFAGVVSDAVSGGGVLPAARIHSNLGGTVPMAWVSLPPGSDEGAESGVIENRASGATAEVTIVDGGFDPVAIPAAAGDEIDILITRDDGTTALRRASVPARRRPRVVRTSPARGRLDVAINANITIIFSEPLPDSVVSGARIRLRQAGSYLPVGGTVSRETGSSVGVTFTPAEPLNAATPYQLVLDGGIVDLAGDPIEGTLVFDFSTAFAPAAPPGGTPTEPPGGTPVEPAPVDVNLWSWMQAVSYGVASGGEVRNVSFEASGPVAYGALQLEVEGDGGFTIIGENCSVGWASDEPLGCTVSIRFDPTGPERAYEGNLHLRDATGVRVTVSLWATSVPVRLTIGASGIWDDRVMSGLVSEPVTLTVTNPSAEFPSEQLDTRTVDCSFWVDIGCTPVDPALSGLLISDDTCDGAVLAPGASCSLRVAFAPTGLTYYATAVVLDRAESAMYGPGGYGTGLVAGSNRYDFPTVSVGADVLGSTVVTNLGDQPTGAISVTLGAGPFTIESNDCAGRTLAPGASCSVSFRYRPTSPGEHSAVLSFETTPGGPYQALVWGRAQ